MGGAIFVGVRYKDNKGKVREVQMDRWTNDLPHRLIDPGFLDQGKAFETFIKEAKKDNEWPYSKLINKITNVEYGVVLIDFITREIYSRNYYVEPGELIFTTNSSASQKMFEQIAELIRRGNIESIVETSFKEEKTRDINIPVDTFVDLVNQRIENEGDRVNFMFTITLKKDVINVDHKSTMRDDSLNNLDDLKAWLKKNGWISKIDEKSFEMED